MYPTHPKYPRIPGRRHWKALEKIKIPELEPDEFLKNWNVTYAEVAKICNCSESTVSSWFISKGKHKPSKAYKIKLAIVHQIWNKL